MLACLYYFCGGECSIWYYIFWGRKLHEFLIMPQVGILCHDQRGVNHSLGRLGRHLIIISLLPLVTIIHATSNDGLVLTRVVSGVLVRC
jgi:hypothetical protein